MAKVKSKRLLGIATTSLAVFEGVFMGLLGVIIVILRTLEDTFAYTEESASLLKGLTFGLAKGALLVVLVPILWFVIGTVIGAIHGAIYNYIATQTGGIKLRLKDDK